MRAPEAFGRLLHLPFTFHAEAAQDGDHCSGDRQNDRNRDLVNQINQRKLRLGLFDDVATVRASLSVLKYLSLAFFAFYHLILKSFF